jgi:hypothetical protein
MAKHRPGASASAHEGLAAKATPAGKLTKTSASGPDSKLLAAFARWQHWGRECAILDSLPADDKSYDERYSTCYGPWHELAAKIVVIPAHSPEGIRAKAEVVRALFVVDHCPGTEFDENESISLRGAWSLVNDMLGKAA